MKEVYANVNLSDQRQDFLNSIRDSNPQIYVIYHEKIIVYANKCFATPEEEFIPPFNNFTQLPDVLMAWVEQELPKCNRPKTLVICGPSRTGKTSWARSLVRSSLLPSRKNQLPHPFFHLLVLSTSLIKADSHPGESLLHEHILECRQGRH